MFNKKTYEECVFNLHRLISYVYKSHKKLNMASRELNEALRFVSMKNEKLDPLGDITGLTSKFLGKFSMQNNQI